MKRGDLVHEAPYPERGIVLEVLWIGEVNILCPDGSTMIFSKEYADKLVVVNERRLESISPR